MESNEKYVNQDNTKATVKIGPIIWGEPGTNMQLVFYQLIHQCTKMILCYFLAPIDTHNPHTRITLFLWTIIQFSCQTISLRTKRWRLKNMPQLSKQDLKLMMIWTPQRQMICYHTRILRVIDHQTCSCSRKTTPRVLGILIAIYEMKLFTQGAICNINSVDQCVVALSKQLTKAILPELSKEGDVTT